MRHVPSHRGRNITLGVAGMLLLALCAAAWNYLRPLPAPTAAPLPLSSATPQATPFAWPASGGAAAEVQGVTRMFTHGPQKRASIGNLAKIITALTVLQKYPMDGKDMGPTLTLSQPDVDLYQHYRDAGGTVVHVAHGEQLTEYSALQAMLLPGADNVADSFAIWAFGSLKEYQAAATQYVAQLGLSDTVIGPDASGASAETLSTPGDMLRLAEQVMAHPVLSKIVAQREAILPIEGHVGSANPLPGKNNMIGIAVGSAKGKGTVLFAARSEAFPGKTVTVLGAFLSCDSLAAGVRAAPPLTETLKANLYLATPVRAGTAIATIRTAWGAEGAAAVKSDLSFLALKGEPVHPEVSLQRAGVSYEPGATIGTVSATAGTASATSDITMTHSLEEPEFWWRLTRR